MQRFNKSELLDRSNEMVWWALCVAIPKCSEEEHKQIFNNQETVEVVFQMNGVDLDFRKVMDTWESQIDDKITRKAEELVEDRVQSVAELLEDLKEDLKNKVREQINQGGEA